jgi:hypothetical protein
LAAGLRIVGLGRPVRPRWTAAGFLAGQAGRVHEMAGIDLTDIQVGLARIRLR